MKKLLIIAAFALPLMWTACGPEEVKETEDVIPAGMRAVDISKDSMGYPVKINAPDSTNGMLMTMSTPNGYQVRVGNNFDLLINQGGAEESDLAAMKALIIASNDAGTNTFTVEDATTLVWETRFGEGEGALSLYHFYMLVKVGEDQYYIRDNSFDPINQFKKEHVDKMLESAKSLRASKAAAPAPEA